MNLKEAFRFQNKLNAMLTEAENVLERDSNVMKVENTYLRKKVMPEAENETVVDTMGAGDSYIAGFLVSWLRKRPLAECMKAGAENAAVTIGYSGAWE